MRHRELIGQCHVNVVSQDLTLLILFECLACARLFLSRHYQTGAGSHRDLRMFLQSFFRLADLCDSLH